MTGINSEQYETVHAELLDASIGFSMLPALETAPFIAWMSANTRRGRARNLTQWFKITKRAELVVHFSHGLAFLKAR
jgi:hypothetical protein